MQVLSVDVTSLSAHQLTLPACLRFVRPQSQPLEQQLQGT